MGQDKDETMTRIQTLFTGGLKWRVLSSWIHIHGISTGQERQWSRDMFSCCTQNIGSCPGSGMFAGWSIVVVSGEWSVAYVGMIQPSTGIRKDIWVF